MTDNSDDIYSHIDTLLTCKGTQALCFIFMLTVKQHKNIVVNIERQTEIEGPKFTENTLHHI